MENSHSLLWFRWCWWLCGAGVGHRTVDFQKCPGVDPQNLWLYHFICRKGIKVANQLAFRRLFWVIQVGLINHQNLKRERGRPKTFPPSAAMWQRPHLVVVAGQGRKPPRTGQGKKTPRRASKREQSPADTLTLAWWDSFQNSNFQI